MGTSRVLVRIVSKLGTAVPFSDNVTVCTAAKCVASSEFHFTTRCNPAAAADRIVIRT